MGFNTLAFVFAFLPLFLAAFYLVPARWRAALLWQAAAPRWSALP